MRYFMNRGGQNKTYQIAKRPEDPIVEHMRRTCRCSVHLRMRGENNISPTAVAKPMDPDPNSAVQSFVTLTSEMVKELCDNTIYGIERAREREKNALVEKTTEAKNRASKPRRRLFRPALPARVYTTREIREQLERAKSSAADWFTEFEWIDNRWSDTYKTAKALLIASEYAHTVKVTVTDLKVLHSWQK